jgi:hypothetical protein
VCETIGKSLCCAVCAVPCVLCAVCCVLCVVHYAVQCCVCAVLCCILCGVTCFVCRAGWCMVYTMDFVTGLCVICALCVSCAISIVISVWYISRTITWSIFWIITWAVAKIRKMAKTHRVTDQWWLQASFNQCNECSSAGAYSMRLAMREQDESTFWLPSLGFSTSKLKFNVGSSSRRCCFQPVCCELANRF